MAWQMSCSAAAASHLSASNVKNGGYRQWRRSARIDARRIALGGGNASRCVASASGGGGKYRHATWRSGWRGGAALFINIKSVLAARGVNISSRICEHRQRGASRVAWRRGSTAARHVVAAWRRRRKMWRL